jgi:hypothetical protein
MSTTPIFRSVRLLPKSAVELDRLYGDKGEIFYDSTTRSLRIFDGADLGGTHLNVSVSVSGTPPEYPTQGSLWFNSTTGAIYLYYQDSSSNQWIAPVVSASGGGGGGASLTAFSVTTASPGTAGLSYNNTSGIFTFTPPNLSSYATTASLSSYVTSTALSSTLGGYATTASLSSYVTSTALSSTLGGYATTSALSQAVSGVAYTLPTSSNTVLGGVKVDGSTITINNGVISASIPTGLSTRSTVTTTTSGLSANTSATATVTAAKGYALYSIQVSAGAWVTVYSSSSAQSNDSSRTITTDPTPGSGVIAEAVTTTATTTYFSPAIHGYNADGSVNTNMYLKIYNNSGSSTAITVTITYLKLEN